MEDADARQGERWSGRFARVGLYGFFGIQAAGLLGLPDNGLQALLRVLGLALLLLVMALVIRVRRPVGQWIRGRRKVAAADADLAGADSGAADLRG
jgi:hypothetical protein